MQMSKKADQSPVLLILFLVLCALALAVGAQATVDLGLVIPFTLQTLILGVLYAFLPLRYRFAVILIYLALGAIGLPVLSNGRGWEYMLSPVVGFFLGFVVVALFPRPDPRFISICWHFIRLHLVILTLGLLVLFLYGTPVDYIKMLVFELGQGALVKGAGWEHRHLGLVQMVFLAY